MCVLPSSAVHDTTLHSEPSGSAYEAYRDELVAAGLLIPLGVRGVFGRSGTFEHVIDQFDALVTKHGRALNPVVMRFPPVFARSNYEKIDHINNFPDLMGSVHTFTGDDKAHRAMLSKFAAKEDWSRDLNASQVMMTPAICYPLYPTVAGKLPEGGIRVDLQGYAFRHEPSDDPARMQIFRMHEYVRIGTPAEALEHRQYWLDKTQEIFRSVGLDVEAVVANDPFFGRGGKVQKAIQREQALKFELVIPICSTDKPTAIGSCNYHLDHFGSVFDITTADGSVAHSACVGFGLERIALALFKKHGLRLEAWPREVRDVLALD
ncbi:MAG TPA: amino acid--[acyl-carrier-protein] ligase [Usitatibacter sp.]|nr:amino acid--[acyl-carrier-protein] ligase [Usitatibacter sp.]